jgi:hypothetical protein
MIASVFKPSGEFIGKFPVASEGELPEKLQELLGSNVRIPLRSYVEAFGQSWTVVGFNPIQLREGSAPQQARADASALKRKFKSRSKEEGQRELGIGIALCIGGVAFSVASFFVAVGIGSSKFLVASGAVFYGMFRIFKGCARMRDR